jgi:predicted DNA-binding transcriptional regulator YafY
MRRADRLFRIVQRLRRRGVTTATQLAQELEVSERTIYRDIADLTLSGVPVRGEAGVGYALPRDFDLPPLMFDIEEIEALVLGARIVKSRADPDLARAADSVLSKVESVLPDHLKERVLNSTLFAFNFKDKGREGEAMSVLRAAIRTQNKVAFQYVDKAAAESRRVVRPLGIFYWSTSWSLGAWCELRKDFRNFRLDRISAVEQLPETFVPEKGRSIQDFFEEQRKKHPVGER